jgi:hypothetical protein
MAALWEFTETNRSDSLILVLSPSTPSGTRPGRQTQIESQSGGSRAARLVTVAPIRCLRRCRSLLEW